MAIECAGQVMGREAVPQLRKALTAADEATRLHAAAALLQGDFIDKAAVEIVSHGLSHRNKEYQEVAFDAICHAGSAARGAVRQIAKGLSHQEEDIRFDAAHALVELGKSAQAAASQLLKTFTEDKSDLVRSMSGSALDKPYMAKALEPSTTVPLLIEALSDPVAGVRMSAAFMLGHYGSNAKPAISALVSRITDLDEFAEVRVCGFSRCRVN